VDYDVVIVGGGPAGLSAALILGRARKRVLLCDAGPPRNAAAERVHGFVTRDGIPPREFRRVAREQIAAYPSVEVRDARALAVSGQQGAFRVEVEGGDVGARRVILAVGMVDVMPDLPGFRELWGKGIFQCPYCHGWEVRDRAFGALVESAPMMDFGLLLEGWSRDVVLFTNGAFEVPGEARERLARAGVGLEERRIRRLIGVEGGAHGPHLEAVELEDGTRVAREVLFARPQQRQPEIVQRLGLGLDDMGYVRVDDHRQTSVRGVYAAGDVTTPMQSAILGASSGAQAAYMLNHELSVEDALAGRLV
jgi:thioredoxin reductase